MTYCVPSGTYNLRVKYVCLSVRLFEATVSPVKRLNRATCHDVDSRVGPVNCLVQVYCSTSSLCPDPSREGALFRTTTSTSGFSRLMSTSIPIAEVVQCHIFSNENPHCDAAARKNTQAITCLIMVALCNRADHYIFMLWFVLLLLLSFFFLA